MLFTLLYVLLLPLLWKEKVRLKQAWLRTCFHQMDAKHKQWQLKKKLSRRWWCWSDCWFNQIVLVWPWCHARFVGVPYQSKYEVQAETWSRVFHPLNSITPLAGILSKARRVDEIYFISFSWVPFLPSRAFLLAISFGSQARWRNSQHLKPIHQPSRFLSAQIVHQTPRISVYCKLSRLVTHRWSVRRKGIFRSTETQRWDSPLRDSLVSAVGQSLKSHWRV